MSLRIFKSLGHYGLFKPIIFKEFDMKIQFFDMFINDDLGSGGYSISRRWLN
jgi:hypothetical protein